MLTLPRPPPNPMDGTAYLRTTAEAAAQQYAVPADTSGTSGGLGKSAGLTYTQHERLRQRKTPNGLLYEHDSPVLDKTVQVPAPKHLLLSSSLNPIPDQTHGQNLLLLRQAREQAYGSNALPNTGMIGNVSLPHMRSPAWDFPGGLDSMLNQTLPMQPSQRYYLQQGAQVPTVHPSALNTPWGPTASAGQELYGPYWPDGTFTPYRPASIRDDRYFAHHFGQQDSYRAAPFQSSNPPSLRRLGKLPTNFNTGQDFVNNQNLYSSQNEYQRHWHQQQAALQTSPSNVFHNANRFAQNYVQSQQVYTPEPQSWSRPVSSQAPPFSVPLQPGPESEQIAFRDRTFTWANKVYSELLLNIQRTFRDAHQSGGGHTKAAPRVSIYPKPPKRSDSHFTESLRTTPGSKEAKRTSAPSTLLHGSGVDNAEPARPQTAIWSPSRRASDFVPPTAFRVFPTINNFPLQQSTSTNSNFRRTSDSLVYQSAQAQHGPNVRLQAESALSTMELLCEQAKKPWLDGMLLVGCLAYGLDLHEKALHWYQAVLKQDASHVEAMSNLAATLHALNRREEALHYWSEAVRLRPSYFEAVEHLIGLLCSTRRAKEAVELITYVESSLKLKSEEPNNQAIDALSDGESDARSHASSIMSVSSNDHGHYDYEVESHRKSTSSSDDSPAPGFGTSGYAIPGAENGRMLALIHAKGNMLYALSDNSAAASAFEDAILIATGQRKYGIRGLISNILSACLKGVTGRFAVRAGVDSKDPILLSPDQAEATARNMFPTTGELPGLEFVPRGIASKAAIATTSNSLLSLAKIYQDAMSSAINVGTLRSTSTRDILALYYLSLSLQRSPSTANNVGILLAGVQRSVQMPQAVMESIPNPLGYLPGVVLGSGIHLALLYYNYGLNLDKSHAHLYTNLGSLLKDIGQLNAAIKMYESAVNCDANFDIALANLANAVKDQGRVADAIKYYKRAVQANPDFAEAVCGLATALNSVCNWHGRGGIYADGGRRDRIHVDENGKIHNAHRSYGWLSRVVDIVNKQLKEGETWGRNTLTDSAIDDLCRQLAIHRQSDAVTSTSDLTESLRQSLESWSGKKWEGSRIVRLVERAIRRIGWQWYQDRHITGREQPSSHYSRPSLPRSLSSPSAPTVLPFHTFTTPLPAKQIRQISQRNALRISVSTLRSPWLPTIVFPPPPPPRPYLIVGYVSSDFNNHPLAHLMQSVFGLHDPASVHAICYATTPSDDSSHRQQIEREAPVFHDASSWSVERLVKQIVSDGVHVLVNLNGYTRGARNEVFAARPAPIHMSFMGFAGTLGAEWCDYVLADEISVPPETLSPWRRNVDIEDRLRPESLVEDEDNWVYSENIIFAKETFFCVDHKQSAPDAIDARPRRKLTDMSTSERDDRWSREQERRWHLRRQLFPNLSESAIILGNFNQLYKIDPATFRMYLRILAAVPNAVLWLLRFPDLGEQHLKAYANEWAGYDIMTRVMFTDVAPKGGHITRASVVDLFLDTPECNAHTTAADVVWSGTPLLTWGRWPYKMCSRMGGSIISSAFPETPDGDAARKDLVVNSEEEYEEHAIDLARGLRYQSEAVREALGEERRGKGTGRLMELRKLLWEGRWESRLFDTRRWVRDVERAYWAAWRKWERGEGGDIWL